MLKETLKIFWFQWSGSNYTIILNSNVHIFLSAEFNLESGQSNRSILSPTTASAAQLFTAQNFLRFHWNGVALHCHRLPTVSINDKSPTWVLNALNQLKVFLLERRVQKLRCSCFNWMRKHSHLFWVCILKHCYLNTINYSSCVTIKKFQQLVTFLKQSTNERMWKCLLFLFSHWFGDTWCPCWCVFREVGTAAP